MSMPPNNIYPDEAEPEPPTLERVIRRTWCLAALADRALLEQEDSKDEFIQQVHGQLKEWASALEIADEFEPDERVVWECPLGELTRRQQIDATWRIEGLAMLASVLGLFELPDYDELTHPPTLRQALGMYDPEQTRELFANVTLPTDEELEQLENRMLALHWRLTHFNLDHEPMDFAEFGRTCWFGPFDVTTACRLADGDLALGADPIADADEDLFKNTYSATRERHQAIRWLQDGGIYSETDLST